MSWPKVVLGELTTKIGSGATPRGGSKAYKTEGIPLVRSMNVHDGMFRSDGLAFIDGEQAKALDNVILSAGDVLLNITGASVARCCRLPSEYAGGRVNQHVAIIRPKTDVIRSDYLEHLLTSPGTKQKLLGIAGGGATREAITKAAIENFEIPLPPLEEQKRIAQILDQADALRRLRTRALDKLNTLGQAIFHEMADDLKTGDDVGFEAIADIQVGYPFKSKYYIDTGGGVRLCRGANVLPGQIDWSNTAKYPEELLGDVEQFHLREGDVVLAMDRPWISSGFKVASIGQQDLPSYLVQRVARLRAKRDEDRTFLLTLVNSAEFQRHCRPTETTIPHISPLEVKSFRFRLPAEESRTRFNLAVKSVTASNILGNGYLGKTETLFASLQHRAFRGEL